MQHEIKHKHIDNNGNAQHVLTIKLFVLIVFTVIRLKGPKKIKTWQRIRQKIMFCLRSQKLG